MMKLKAFNVNKELKKLKFQRKKNFYCKLGSIIFVFLVVVISVIYFTYSKFTASDSFIILDSTVGDFTSSASDYSLAFYVDGEETSEIPTEGNYDVTITCDKGATGEWLKNTKQILLSNATQTGTKCNVNFVTSKEYQDESGASVPELYAGLIPITYDDSNNIVVADIASEWYSYDNHEWANAILIDQNNSSIKAKYINEDGSFKSGTTVSISDVLQMYVWIPRYKYKLFNATGSSTSAQMIEVEFESNGTAKSTGSTNGEWLTHPAFTFGDTELEGIWVGKFESSGSTSEIKIIPNVSSLRSQTVGNMFNASRLIETTAKYGLSSDEIDTHMMKNLEWGAVAYLTNSKYGRYESNGSCISSGGCEVWINNNSSYTTGCAGSSVSASSTSSCNQWNTPNGVNASTTGNIYGIYDMSGGAWEYVMGNYNKTVGSSGINFSSIESKYYDVYTGTSTSYGKLGDATKEVYNWNSDYADFVNSSYPWFHRGAQYSHDARTGVFAFTYDNGDNVYSSVSFRVVLVRA